MPISVSLADAARTIIHAPAPVLLVDTSALLDVIRAPQRREIRHAVIEAAIVLHDKVTAVPPQLWVVVAPFVPKEWDDHVDATVASLAAHIRTVDEHIITLAQVAHLATPDTAVPAVMFASLQLPAYLRSRAQALLNVALLLEEDLTCIIRARHRVIQDTPPASKGKGEFKDCEIIEHYLALCRALQGHGFAPRRVFVTANRNDYCAEPERSKLHPILTAEFDAAGLRYAADFAWANGLL